MKTSIKFSTILLLAFSFAKTVSAASYEALGNQWYERRAEGSVGIVADPRPINMAISYFEKAFDLANTEETAVALLKCYYFKGSFVPMSLVDQKTIFTKGTGFGEEMAKRYPNSAAVKYWLAALWGRWSKSYGAIAAARAGVADKLKDLSEAVIRLNPSYNDAGGFVILGLVNFYSPHIPFFLTWPSDKVALENLQRAALQAPTISNNLCYAKALIKSGKKDVALILLKKTLSFQPRAEKLIEDRNGLIQIKELLSE